MTAPGGPATNERPADAPAAGKSLLLLLGAGQFIMVLDSSVMNVSISQLVHDLDTTVASIQLAITAYTLVMAAFMLTGAKIGSMLGGRRAFVLGLGIYGIGSLLTSLAPNIGMLLIGWSLVEGLGAVLVIPAIASLTAATYRGAERAFAFGLLGGVSAAGVAVGPIIGGWVTANLTWRLVFAAETVVVIVIIAFSRRIPNAARPDKTARLDLTGSALSAVGLALAVLGVLQSATWGWLRPRSAPTIAGHEITPFGFSPTLFVIAAGAGVLWLFVRWEQRRAQQGAPVLLRLELLSVPRLRAALETLVVQCIALSGTFFVLPLYLQVVLGFDAFRSGKAIFPMSVAMFVAAIGAPRFAGRIAPRRIVRTGFGLMVVGEIVLLASIDYDLRRVLFGVAIMLLGAGMGLVVSQAGNVAVSSVAEQEASEVGGLQGTAQNIGQSLGTALIGAILLGGLVGAFGARIDQNPAIPQSVRTEIHAATEKGVPFVAADDVETVLRENGVPADQTTAIVDSYKQSQLDALKAALLAVAVLIVIGFAVTRRLPDEPLVVGPAGLEPTTSAL